ncbi:hypothetical protein LTR85_005608 [Meristemomyces frigidus]|nr:hypothetical protein LTR85_005608 [Meristemomyces frigidus]
MSDLKDYSDSDGGQQEQRITAQARKVLLGHIQDNTALAQYYRNGVADGIPKSEALDLLEGLVQRKGLGHDWAQDQTLLDYHRQPPDSAAQGTLPYDPTSEGVYLKPGVWENSKYRWDEQTPREVYMHRALVGLKNSWSIVQWRGWKLYANRYMYRIYMEYCPGGNLDELIERHAEVQGTRDGDGSNLRTQVPSQPDSVSAVIGALTVSQRGSGPCSVEYLRGSCSRCVPNERRSRAEVIRSCRMEGRDSPSRSEAVQQAVPKHCKGGQDINPGGIVFLADPSPPHWRGIPRTKLGDFGLAIHRNTEGLDNPSDINIGAAPWCSPEQVNDYANVEFNDMWPWRTALDAPSRFDLPPLPIPAEVWEKYPNKLISLVQRCMELVPSRRIKADQLLWEITRVVQDYGDEPFNGLPLKFGELQEDEMVQMVPDNGFMCTTEPRDARSSGEEQLIRFNVATDVKLTSTPYLTEAKTIGDMVNPDGVAVRALRKLVNLAQENKRAPVEGRVGDEASNNRFSRKRDMPDDVHDDDTPPAQRSHRSGEGTGAQNEEKDHVLDDIDAAWLELFAGVYDDDEAKDLKVAVYPPEVEGNPPWDVVLELARTAINAADLKGAREAWNQHAEAGRRAPNASVRRKVQSQVRIAKDVLDVGHITWPGSRMPSPTSTEKSTVPTASQEQEARCAAGDALGFGTAETGLGEDWNFDCAVVVKQCYSDGDRWQEQLHWSGDIEDRVPKEAVLQRQVSSLKQSHSVVEYRSHGVYKDLQMTKLYMEYCPHGDLEQVIVEHRKDKNQDGEELLIFPCCTGSTQMGFNSVCEGTAPVNFTSPAANAMQLGDFGLAWAVKDKRLRNPEDLIEYGTKGYTAPEGYPYQDPTLNHQHAMSSAADIYAIGRTMHSLMDLRGGREVDEEALAFTAPPGSEPRISDWAEANYSGLLVWLVKRCYESLPADRIPVNELWSEIRQAVTARRGDEPTLPYQSLESYDVLRYKGDKIRTARLIRKHSPADNWELQVVGALRNWCNGRKKAPEKTPSHAERHSTGAKSHSTGDVSPSRVSSQKRRNSAGDAKGTAGTEGQRSNKRARSASALKRNDTTRDLDDGDAQAGPRDSNEIDKGDVFAQTWRLFIEKAQANDSQRSKLYSSLY